MTTVDITSLDPLILQGRDGVGITGAILESDGRLRLTMSDNTTIDAGPIVGALSVDGQTGHVDLSGNYAAKLSATGSYSYDTNGNVSSTPDGTSYVWESDGAGGYRVHTETVGGATRTYSYNTDGTLASIA